MLRPWTLSLINVLAATTLVACGDSGNTTDASAGSTGAATSGATDNPTTTVGTSNATDEATTTPTTTLPTTTEGTTMVGGETAADGEACSANDDCASVGCLKWRDLEMGECVPAPAGGNTRIAGTLLDFVAGTPISGAELRVVGALTVALSADPATAPPVFTATSEADGHVDVTSTEPLAEGVGVVGVITGGAYYTTVTGIAAPINPPDYGPMNGNRDIWALPAATLTEWSGYLMTDPEIMPSLPLGDAGGVVGFVRDGNGMGKAGAKIVSETNGAATTAKVRYLSDDGVSFNADATGASGIFVLVAPSLAEKFKVEGGTVIGTAGSAKKAVFVMILTEP